MYIYLDSHLNLWDKYSNFQDAYSWKQFPLGLSGFRITAFFWSRRVYIWSAPKLRTFVALGSLFAFFNVLSV